MNGGAPIKPPAEGRTGFAGDLQTRLLSALVLIAIAVFGVYVGGVWTGVIAAIFVAVVHVEWTSVTEGAIAPSVRYRRRNWPAVRRSCG